MDTADLLKRCIYGILREMLLPPSVLLSLHPKEVGKEATLENQSLRPLIGLQPVQGLGKWNPAPDPCTTPSLKDKQQNLLRGRKKPIQVTQPPT